MIINQFYVSSDFEASHTERSKHRLDGFTTAEEDWHARVTFLGVYSLELTLIIQYAIYTTLSFIQVI